MATDRLRTVIIGAGSAGATAAWRLNAVAGDVTDIVVFEREARAGGRAWDINFAGERIEVGGTILHSSGRYTAEILKQTGLHEGGSALTVPGEKETYGFWTDQGFPILTGSTGISLAWGVLKHIGLRSVLNLVASARSAADRWNKVYGHQNAGKVWLTPQDLIRDLNISDFTEKTLAEWVSTIRVSKRTQDDVVVPIIHNMYNQGSEINSFAAAVGLAGAGLSGGHLYSVEGGNWQLFQRILEKIDVSRHFSTSVTSITPRQKNEVGRVEYLVKTDDGNITSADAVILAAPLALADITIGTKEVPTSTVTHPYQRVNTTLVVGKPRPEFFGLASGANVPGTIFTADSAQARFKSFGITGYSGEYREHIYKIFSADRPVDDEYLAQVFERVDEVTHFDWAGAYPKLAPRPDHASFEIAPGLFYANAFETVAGSIEVEAVAGYNTAALTAQYLRRW